MKTLYISDLDGTLLDHQGTVSSRSVSLINGLIRQGLRFTVCTGRSVSFCKKTLKELDLNIPIAVMNGAVIYDLARDECTRLNGLQEDIVPVVHKLTDSKDIESCWFLFDTERNEETIAVERPYSPMIAGYFTSSGETVVFGVPFENIQTQKPIYAMCFSKDLRHLQQLKTTLEQFPVKTDLYHDVYQENMWVLDIFDLNVSKESCVRFYRNEYKPDRIVSFGDSENDIGMFLESDDSYCTESGDEKAKATAGHVIEDSSESVAECLMSVFR